MLLLKVDILGEQRPHIPHRQPLHDGPVQRLTRHVHQPVLDQHVHVLGPDVGTFRVRGKDLLEQDVRLVPVVVAVVQEGKLDDQGDVCGGCESG